MVSRGLIKDKDRRIQSMEREEDRRQKEWDWGVALKEWGGTISNVSRGLVLRCGRYSRYSHPGLQHSR